MNEEGLESPLSYSAIEESAATDATDDDDNDESPSPPSLLLPKLSILPV